MRRSSILSAGLVLAALAVLQACADGAPTDATSVAGLWDFAAQRVASGFSCADTGTFRFETQGDVFAGLMERVGTCTSSGTTWTYQQTDSVSHGVVNGSTVTFSVAALGSGTIYCSMAGQTAGSPPDAIAGNGSCGVQTIDWAGGRGRPVSTVQVVPPLTAQLAGGTIQLSADIRDAGGTRLFLRGVAWSTDNAAVATVDSTGLVRSVGAGTATITATVEGHSAHSSLTVGAATALVSVGAGDALSCGLGAGGDARCWGIMFGNSGPRPVLVAGGLQFTFLSTGHNFACGIVTSGAAYCFGSNDSGQLGNGTTTPSATPVAVAGGLTFRALSAGRRHACGITGASTAVCWGANGSGQLGNGTQAPSLVPVPVSGGMVLTQISAGGTHSCAVRAVDSLAFCWGDNAFGQLGDSTNTMRLVPTRVAFAGTLVPLATGLTHTCAGALITKVYCWGNNASGQLGTGDTQSRNAPVQVAGPPMFGPTAGSLHSCALGTTGGASYCWGANSWGQLGNGTTVNSLVPVQVAGGQHFVLLSAGLYNYSDEAVNMGNAGHTCGIVPNGGAWCWGVNNIGQLGVGDSTFSTAVPKKVWGQP